MGNYQSKASPPASAPPIDEKLVTERLQALQLKYKAVDADDSDGASEIRTDGQKYVSKSPSLSISAVEAWELELLDDPKNRLALAALSSVDPKTILTSRATTIKDQHIFNVQLPFEGAPIPNQRSSGRCWLFASTNVFRIAYMQRYNLDSFELSQAYLFFWDKLEKANYFLEQILDTADQPLDSRLLQTLLSSPVSDGGQWDMVFNLVNKYGLVPQALYPDSFNAQSSGVINGLITTKLREDALVLRELVASSKCPSEKGGDVDVADKIAATKEKFIREIHLILTLTLGPPPSPDKEFTWTYLDTAAKKPCTITTTPLHFASDLLRSTSITSNKPQLALPLRNNNPKPTTLLPSIPLPDTISLVHDPRHDYYTHLTVSRLNNISPSSSAPSRNISYINVPMPVLKRACLTMLRSLQPVFFGCDVGQFSSPSTFPGPSAEGIMDSTLLDWGLAFNVTLGMTKSQRLQTGESAMTHAMVLTGVHVEEGERTVRWRVMNSWGKERGHDGYMVMSDRWMDEFCYQAVVGTGFVEQRVRDVLEKEPVVLPRWDPLGALA